MDAPRLLLGPARPLQGHVAVVAAVALAVVALGVLARAVLAGSTCGSAPHGIVAWALPAGGALLLGRALFDAGALTLAAGAALGTVLAFLAWTYPIPAWCA